MLPRVPLGHLIQVLELEFEPRSDSKACALAQCVYNDFDATDDSLRGLAFCNSWDRKESDMTERLN